MYTNNYRPIITALVSEMTYYVSSGTLNSTNSTQLPYNNCSGGALRLVDK